MKNKFLLFLLLFSAFVFNFSFIKTPLALAVGATSSEQVEEVEISLGEKLILKDGTPVKDVFNSTDDMLNLIVKVLFVGAGLVLFIMIVGAGFAMIQGGGKDAEKAKTTMTSAVLGFIIMFAAYWIMQIIQLLTGINMGF
ncbi:hypothetical protein KKI22_00165 [Patescibacteria group bacterium]|nr:hypothetical protein [Patescibacteria group bacterium]